MKPCANCRHCRIFWKRTLKCEDGQKELRVRCAMGCWQTLNGHAKDYPFYTVLERVAPDQCHDFDSMTDDGARVRDEDLFIINLGENLPQGRLVRGFAS